MCRNFAVCCAVAWSASAASCSLAQAQPFPAPTYGLNNANTNVSLYRGVTSQPFIRWQVLSNVSAIDNPALVLDGNGVLYLAGMTPVIAATGAPAGMSFVPWRDSTPALDSQGNVYQWEHGRLHAYSSTGAARWTGPTTNFSDGSSVRVAPNGTILATGGDSLLRAYSPAGQLLWTAATGSTLPPAIDAAGNIYTNGGDNGGPFRSFDSNGNLRWTLPQWEETSNEAPIFGPDGNLYISSYFGFHTRVVNPATGATIRQFNIDPAQAITSNTIYICGGNILRAHDLFGQTRWQSLLPQGTFLSQLVVDAAGNVFCTSEENQLFAFSATGSLLWSMQLPHGGWQSLPPIIGSDGTLYVYSGGTVLAIGGVVPTPGAAAVLGLGMLTCARRRR